jgi:hypothetical protein
MSGIIDDAVRLRDSVQSLVSLLPDHVQKEWAEREKREAGLREQLRQECALVLPLLAQAIARPSVSRSDLEAAQKHVMKALSISCVLDPE